MSNTNNIYSLKNVSNYKNIKTKVISFKISTEIYSEIPLFKHKSFTFLKFSLRFFFEPSYIRTKKFVPNISSPMGPIAYMLSYNTIDNVTPQK